MSLDELVRAMCSFLDPNGSFSVLLPFQRLGYFQNLAVTAGFFLQEIWIIRQTPKHDPFRVLCLLSYKKRNAVIEKEMCIRDNSGKYSAEFNVLMNEFYE